MPRAGVHPNIYPLEGEETKEGKKKSMKVLPKEGLIPRKEEMDGQKLFEWG